ncbi:putative propionate kinase [BD1-7 clade bacterium]|uniref:Putative propionate kinase n=1 Tax=BD1-7 clade bacterium TaxID=2029982 RepID=A0A5S9QZL3_9GAMM|nr:putative propionate kinase [BD1-7 clade bacterium]
MRLKAKAMRKQLALAVNPGSSSLKFALYHSSRPGLPAIISGSFTDLDVGQPKLHLQVVDRDISHDFSDDTSPPGDDIECLDWLIRLLKAKALFAYLDVVLIRAVHCGKHTSPLVPLYANLLENLEYLSAAIPLHVPAFLRVARSILQRIPHAAVFGCPDTAFHKTIPVFRQWYAIDPEFHAMGFRRFGFHGLSFGYVADTLADRLKHKKAVIGHLGSGSSICALDDGRSVNTTMGYSPLSGLPGATRSGDIDPILVLSWASQLQNQGLSPDDICLMLYQSAGLQALAGEELSVEAMFSSRSPRCELAYRYYLEQVLQSIGAQALLLGGIDLVVLTGAIARSARLQHDIREKLILSGLLDRSTSDVVENFIVCETDESKRMMDIFHQYWRN